MPATASNPHRFLLILLHAGFFISGISTTLIGQVLPILAEKFALNDKEAGNFFPAQFAGSLLGTLLTNWFGRKGRFSAASAAGCLLMAAGVLMLNAPNYELCLAGFFVNGFGTGLTLPSINMLILELNRTRGAAALSVLNFFWGVGAILSQPFVDFFARGTSIVAPTAILTIGLALIGLALALAPGATEPRSADGIRTADEAETPIWTSPVAWGIAFFNFVHVGFESAIGGWLKTYTNRVEDGAAPALFPPIFLFFVFFVVGRGTAPLFFRYLDENRMLLASLFVVLAGMLVLLFARDALTLGVGAAIAGFGSSSIFPTNVSRFTKTFGPSASRRATPFFICGTLGAAATTWIVGYVSESRASLRAGMFVLLISVLLLIVLQIVLARKTAIVGK